MKRAARNTVLLLAVGVWAFGVQAVCAAPKIIGGEFTTERVIGRLGMVKRDQSPIFAQPGRAPKYYVCRAGTNLVLTHRVPGWYGVLMIDGRIGWISSNRVELLNYNVVTRSPAFLSLMNSEWGRRIVATAFRFLGTPYKWGGDGPDGIDCSGFVRAVFAANGKGLPRVSCEQALVGKPVSFDQLQPGDRLYFSIKGKRIDHTGIYIGNGYFIHSSSNRNCVAVDTLIGTRYGKALVAARR